MNRGVPAAKRHSRADDYDAHDDDHYDGRQWDMGKALNSDRYDGDFVSVWENGENFTLKYFQQNGFTHPLLFKEKSGLGLRMPSSSFTVDDVKDCVGAKRLVDVMDVTTQKNMFLKMRDWCAYYNNPNRKRLLNVISLEFSHTKLDHYVESPIVVRQLDWLDRAWPLYLKRMQTDTTNNMDEMKYPKVRKYVLMSVKDCYTDWHIDFGGTSVWYHILRGEKIFWIIPPTEENISVYERWCLSGQQGTYFFGDLVPRGQCQRVVLKAGTTFFIPSGWMHAVFTPKDSLVFGGNYLHTYSAGQQHRVWKVEDKTHVKLRFRYPYYTELHWYVMARYVACVLGREHVFPLNHVDLHLVPLAFENRNTTNGKTSPKNDSDSKGSNWDVKRYKESAMESLMKQENERILRDTDPRWQNVTKHEYQGLRMVRDWVKQLPETKRYLPVDIPHPDLLLDDVDLLLRLHEHDNPEAAVTGNPLLRWAPDAERLLECGKATYTSAVARGRGRGRGWGLGRGRGRGGRTSECGPTTPKFVSDSGPSGPTYRRVRCGVCEPCRRENCRECPFCVDMACHGGPGTTKQCCIQKQCINMKLPKGAECEVCHRSNRATDAEQEADDYVIEDDLFECGICWKVSHPACLRAKLTNQPIPMRKEKENSKEEMMEMKSEPEGGEKDAEKGHDEPATENEVSKTKADENGNEDVQDEVEKVSENGDAVQNGKSIVADDVKESPSEDVVEQFHMRPNSSMPNYWECFMCTVDGREGCLKPRIPKGLVLLRKLEQAAADGARDLTTAKECSTPPTDGEQEDTDSRSARGRHSNNDEDVDNKESHETSNKPDDDDTNKDSSDENQQNGDFVTRKKPVSSSTSARKRGYTRRKTYSSDDEPKDRKRSTADSDYEDTLVFLRTRSREIIQPKRFINEFVNRRTDQ